MRLFEITQTKYSNIAFDNDAETGDELGSGYYSTATAAQDTVSINKVFKRPRDIEIDPYYTYIKYIADNDLASTNTYFPKVYNVRENLEGKTIFNMERLIPLKDVPFSVLLRLYNRIVDVDLSSGSKTEVIDRVSWVIDNAVETGFSARILDSDLAEAVSHIRAVIRSLKEAGVYANADLENSDNIMYRMSKYGLQLVITDPIA